MEDDEAVRTLTCAMLDGQGYNLISAPGPQEALQAALDYGGRIDLLLTDVIMPYMSGRALFERLLDSRPGLKVLYMSGYTNDIIAKQGLLEPGTHLLTKPFSVDRLLDAVGKALAAGVS